MGSNRCALNLISSSALPRVALNSSYHPNNRHKGAYNIRSSKSSEHFSNSLKLTFRLLLAVSKAAM